MVRRYPLSFLVGLLVLACSALPAAAQLPSATLIGNGTYTNAVWNNLSCSPNDVSGMQAQLQSSACNWLTTASQNQTAVQMRNEVATSLPQVPNDTWIFYYTGHGDNTANFSGGLAGVDDNGSGSSLYYPSAFASDVSTGIPLSRCIILDSCGSGGFAKLANIFLQARAINALFLTATDDSLNCAICNNVTNVSRFTDWVLKGLQGAADGACGQAPNGVITFDELDCYLKTNYDPLGVTHLYIPNGLGNTGICTVRATPAALRTWGSVKVLYR